MLHYYSLCEVFECAPLVSTETFSALLWDSIFVIAIATIFWDSNPYSLLNRNHVFEPVSRSRIPGAILPQYAEGSLKLVLLLLILVTELKVYHFTKDRWQSFCITLDISLLKANQKTNQ